MSASSPSRRNSILIAAAVAVGLAVWLLSGLGGGLPETTHRSNAETQTAMSVSVRRSRARELTRTIIASARTEPDRAIEIKAETEGRIVAIGVERGEFVAAGRSIVQIDMRDRQARLAETEALIRQRELEYEAAQRLLSQRFVSEAELAGKNADLLAARAARERIVLDIGHTQIRAPFDAVVFDRLVEIGDYVASGDPIAQLVDSDPLIVVANVNERDVGSLTSGGTGRARIQGGREIEGRIRYLAPVAEETTRSFRIELEIPNPDRQLRVGTSAELLLGAEAIVAHEVSSALLALADDGTVGVKIVDNNNRVRFVPITIAESTPSGGMLITGLPAEARIITVGQGFVADGQIVAPTEEDASLSQAGNERPY